MINLNHKFALLDTGEIEPLYYDNGEPRNAYEEDGKYYLDHDVWFRFFGGLTQAYMHDEIVKTADTEEELTEAQNND